MKRTSTLRPRGKRTSKRQERRACLEQGSPSASRAKPLRGGPLYDRPLFLRGSKQRRTRRHSLWHQAFFKMFVTFVFLCCCFPADMSRAAENRYPATISVYFSPDGGCTQPLPASKLERLRAHCQRSVKRKKAPVYVPRSHESERNRLRRSGGSSCSG